MATVTTRPMTRPMIKAMLDIVDNGGVVLDYRIKTASAVGLIRRGFITAQRHINGRPQHWLTPAGLHALIDALPPEEAVKLPSWQQMIEQAKTDAQAENEQHVFCPDASCSWKVSRPSSIGCIEVTPKMLLNRHVASQHLRRLVGTTQYWGHLDTEYARQSETVQAIHADVQAWLAQMQRHEVELIGPDASGNWGFKCLTGGCDTLWSGYAADEIEAVAEEHGAIAADSQRPEDASAAPADADVERALVVSMWQARRGGDTGPSAEYVIGWISALVLKGDQPIDFTADEDPDKACQTLAKIAGAILALDHDREHHK